MHVFFSFFRPNKSRVSLAVLLAVVVALIAVPSGRAAADTPLPVDYNGLTADFWAAAHPDSPPLGANDWKCRPSAAHPRPVVLVHGTDASMQTNWYALSPLLKNHGYCVFALNWGVVSSVRVGGYGLNTGGDTDVPTGAQELKKFVGKVKSATGAKTVDLVGHSLGGSMPRYYISRLGGASSVHSLVALSPSNHGTDFDGLLASDAVAGAAHQLEQSSTAAPVVDALGARSKLQQVRGSRYIESINAQAPHHGVEPGVSYTVIATRYDTTVTPFGSQFLAAGPNVTNILLQDKCPQAKNDHWSIAFGRYSLGLVLHSLDPKTPAAPCSESRAEFGG